MQYLIVELKILNIISDYLIDEPGWFGIASDTMYFKPGYTSSFELVILDSESLGVSKEC